MVRVGGEPAGGGTEVCQRVEGQECGEVTFSLSARASSRGLLSLSHVAVTPVPVLAHASNTAFSPAEGWGG